MADELGEKSGDYPRTAEDTSEQEVDLGGTGTAASAAPDPSGSDEYPHGLRLVCIAIAVNLSMFLV